MIRPLHIVVTGSSGFIGQSVTRTLLSRGHRITAMVRKGAVVPEGASALFHDLGSGPPANWPDDVDAVAHLAQSRAYRSFPGDAGELFRVNVAGTNELLNAGASYGLRCFCLVSSGTVYEPYESSMQEDVALAPISMLGATKLAAEVIAKPFSSLFPVSTLRLFAPYGPGQSERLIPDLINRIRSGRPVTLPETGGGMSFTPTFTDDIAAVIVHAIEETWDGTLNVASTQSLTVEEAAKLISTALGREPVFERKPIRAPVIVPDLSKLGTRYDMKSFRPFAEGIRATVSDQA